MKRFVYLGLAVVIVVLGWTAAWFFLANEGKKAVLALADADGVNSPRVTCQSLSVSGFPFRFDLDCVDGMVQSGDVVASLAELRASILVYRPTHAILSAKGPMAIADAFTGSRQRLDFSQLEASVRLEGWRIGRVSVHGENLALNDTVVGDMLLAKAQLLEAHLIDIPEQHDVTAKLAALATFVSLEGVDAPGWQIADGRTSFEAEINGLPDDVRDFGSPDLLARFREAGGKLKLFGFKGDDAVGSFDTTGELTVDDKAQLDGQLKLTSNGVIERTGDLFPPEWKTLIIGSKADDGSYSQTLTIKGGTVLSGLIPIGQLPPLE